jgi:hypothetical protein
MLENRQRHRRQGRHAKAIEEFQIEPQHQGRLVAQQRD